jgi:outer membrane immunogenic protein
MKKLVMCVAAAAALAAGPAMAADMPPPTYKAPPVVAAWTWAGFYLGGHGGYGWKENSFEDTLSLTPLVTIGHIKSKGWVAGAQAGYNWQYGAWVVGLELDGSATDIHGVVRAGPFPVGFVAATFDTETEGDRVKQLGTARARVGYAANSGTAWNVLLYGTAGLAWERVTRETSSTLTGGIVQFSAGSSSRDIFGWVAGAGIEVQLANTNWIARAEYLHYDFGNIEGSSIFIVPGNPVLPFNGGSQRIDMARGALSYKFTPGT